jgi:hypothetical protein
MKRDDIVMVRSNGWWLGVKMKELVWERGDLLKLGGANQL